MLYTFCTFCYFIEPLKVWKKPKYNFLVIYIYDIFFFVIKTFLRHCTLFIRFKNHSLNYEKFYLSAKMVFENYMVLNSRRFYYMTVGLSTTKNRFVFETSTIVTSAVEHMVLGTTTDSRSTIYSHLKQLTKMKLKNKLKKTDKAKKNSLK